MTEVSRHFTSAEVSYGRFGTRHCEYLHGTSATLHTGIEVSIHEAGPVYSRLVNSCTGPERIEAVQWIYSMRTILEDII